MPAPDPTEIRRFHRWFAVECNNRAWDLAALPSRTADQDREMLLTAFASAYHWSEVGEPVNFMRGDMLLACVHSLLGRGEQGLHYARRCLEFCEAGATKAQAADWDVAFAHLQMSLAGHAVGDGELHALHHARAAALGRALDEEDRKIFEEEFARVPAPPADEESA